MIGLYDGLEPKERAEYITIDAGLIFMVILYVADFIVHVHKGHFN